MSRAYYINGLTSMRSELQKRHRLLMARYGRMGRMGHPDLHDQGAMIRLNASFLEQIGAELNIARADSPSRITRKESGMTTNEACEAILGKAAADAITSAQGLEWCVLAAMAAAQNIPAQTEALATIQAHSARAYDAMQEALEEIASGRHHIGTTPQNTVTRMMACAQAALPRRYTSFAD